MHEYMQPNGYSGSQTDGNRERQRDQLFREQLYDSGGVDGSGAVGGDVVGWIFADQCEQSRDANSESERNDDLYRNECDGQPLHGHVVRQRGDNGEPTGNSDD